jgi:alkylhydroperoxidase/carboxymuconolactone decarboxylase family protein YurZ
MTLEAEHTTFLFDLEDAIAYEFFMNNLPVIMGDSLENPDITDEEIAQTIEAITLLAGMSYKIAEKFGLMRIANKRTNDRIESD